MGARGAACPPLQGTVQAPGAGGCIWEGSRGGPRSQPTQKQHCPGPPPPPAELAGPGSGHCSGQALPPRAGDQTRKTNSADTYRSCPPHPLPRVPFPVCASPLPGNCPSLSAQRRTELPRARLGRPPLPAPGLGSPAQACPHWEPRGRAQARLWLRGGKGCWPPLPAPRGAPLTSHALSSPRERSQGQACVAVLPSGPPPAVPRAQGLLGLGRPGLGSASVPCVWRRACWDFGQAQVLVRDPDQCPTPTVNGSHPDAGGQGRGPLCLSFPSDTEGEWPPS